MQQFIEKLISRLEEESKFAVSLLGGKTSSYIAGCCDTNKNTISIVNQLAEEYKPRTNADKIRSMDDYEMSRDLLPMIEEVCEDGVPCEEWFLEWLQSEVKDGE